MTLQQLQYLMEVYRTGSVSGAAKRLFLSQSSLSSSISSLESELGFPIFIRQKNGMIPTVHGAHVIEQAARICESYQVMLTPDSGKKQAIRISCPAYAPLDNAFVRLLETYKDSGTVFSTDAFTTAAAIQKLSALELDIVVLMNHESRILSVETLLRSKGLEWQRLATIPVYIQLGVNHRLYKKQEIHPEELEYDLFADDIQDPLVHNDFLKGIIHLAPERTVSVKSNHARNLLVSKGLAYTVGAKQPENICTAYGLRNIPLAGVSYIITLVTNPLNSLPQETKTFSDLISLELSGNTDSIY